MNAVFSNEQVYLGTCVSLNMQVTSFRHRASSKNNNTDPISGARSQVSNAFSVSYITVRLSLKAAIRHRPEYVVLWRSRLNMLLPN